MYRGAGMTRTAGCSHVSMTLVMFTRYVNVIAGPEGGFRWGVRTSELKHDGKPTLSTCHARALCISCENRSVQTNRIESALMVTCVAYHRSRIFLSYLIESNLI